MAPKYSAHTRVLLLQTADVLHDQFRGPKKSSNGTHQKQDCQNWSVEHAGLRYFKKKKKFWEKNSK